MNSYVIAGYLITFLAIGGHVTSLVVRQRKSRARAARVLPPGTGSTPSS